MTEQMAGIEPARVLVPGIGVGGYRSLREVQALGPLRKVTLLAGQNNTGKSNILRFAASFLRPQIPELQWVDQPQPEGPPLRMQFAHAEFAPAPGLSAENRDSLLDLFARPVFHPVAGDEVWLTYANGAHANAGPQWVLDDVFLSEAIDELGGMQHLLGRASSDLTSTAGGDRLDDLRRVLSALFPLRLPAVAAVGAFRQISDAGRDLPAGTDDQHSGRNLVRRLAELEGPSPERWAADRPRFDAINEFARTVLDDPGVTIRIPATQDQIVVAQGGRVLPLASLGTGIHQVIILAAAATLLQETLVCIEEPEVHLHPLLQRKLIRYLSESTSNQYLIATHSAHLLDYERACILHVKHDGARGTLITTAATMQSVSDLCSDLGYRPSDLVQSNAVVWVEGPSDRVYLRHWLEMLAPGEFVEGIHYSIMFYGGALLNHLTADDPAIDEFISLRRLNRHSAILIDSDKSSGQAGIGATKTRIRGEFDHPDMPGFAWVTACRTIENYVPREALSRAVADVHPRGTHQPPAGKWDQPLRIVRGARMSRRSAAPSAESATPEQAAMAPDKVKVARRACLLWAEERPTDLPLDLRPRMAQVIDFIRRANGDNAILPGSRT